MQARRASRELTLIVLSQIENEDISKINEDEFENIVLESVRLLSSNAGEDLSIALSNLQKIKDEILEYEANHKDNLERPINVSNIPVTLPMTSDLVENLDIVISTIEKTDYALEIAELATLSDEGNVKKYVKKIFKNYSKNKDEIDNIIKEYAVGWDISRIFKIDKNILRIAITELLYVKEVPVKVVIDEALELARKYSTDDSPSFINGILARVVNTDV